jgi:hypothetical protein
MNDEHPAKQIKHSPPVSKDENRTTGLIEHEAHTYPLPQWVPAIVAPTSSQET